MGGNAFPEAERLTKSRYDMLAMGLQEIFNRGKINARIPRSYNAKDSFGDMDVIVPNREEADKILLQLGPILGSIRNPQGYNLLVEYIGQKVQVDLNIVGEEMDFAFWYFSYNDLGNLIGRIAHRQGLKFGHAGLTYPHRINTTAVGEYVLTTDVGKALRYLGFDDVKFFQGFDTLEEMFEWTVDSRYFEGAAYPLEHRNHKSRVRDSKRKNYMAFMDYLEAQEHNLLWIEADKDFWLKKHFAVWPDLEKQYTRAEVAFKQRLDWKERFGGGRAMELTGLVNQELGRFVDYLREAYPLEQFSTIGLAEADRLLLKAYKDWNRL